ncbi:MAG: GNAT family N-acetyltransferase [Pseudomonadota bacterium]
MINIRKATTADAKLISDWNRAMAWETEHKDLPEPVILRGVQRLIEKPVYGFYLLAEIDGSIAGTLMVTTEWSDWRDGLFWWIQSVYVAPEFRRKGVYRALYNEVKSLAKQHPDVCGYRLYVEKDNEVAQRTYEQLGMHRTDYFMYEEMTSNTADKS